MKKNFTLKIVLFLLSCFLFLGINAQDVIVSEAPFVDWNTTYNTGLANEANVSTAGITSIASKKPCALTTNVNCLSISSAYTYYLEVNTPSANPATIDSALFNMSGNNSGTTEYVHEVWYSKSSPFDVTNADSIKFVFANYGAPCSDIVIRFPEGVKSYRIYKKIKITANPIEGFTLSPSTGTDAGANQTINIRTMNVWLKSVFGPQAPKVKTLSIGTANGTITADTIRVNLDYALYTAGLTSVNTSAISFTCDSTLFTHKYVDLDSTSVLSSFIVGDSVKLYVYNNDDATLYRPYVIITSADIPAPAITDAANKSQSVKQGVAIEPIKFPVENGASVEVTGLPAGIINSFASDTVTISGTPTDAFATYNYTVTVTGIVGADPATVTATGAITVKDPAVKSILYLVKDAATVTSLPTIDNFYNALNLKYDVTARAAQANFTGNYDAYDLIVLQESLNGGNAATANHELRLIKDVDKPILNTKSYFYTLTDRWDWGKPTNGDTRAAVTVKQPTHPIFDGVSIVGDSVVIYNSYLFKNIQPTTIEGIGGYVIATTSHYANVAIHEVPAAIRLTSGTSKYLMISIFQSQFDDLSANGLKLLDNAVTYLLGTTAFTPVLNSAATLSSLSISAGSLTPAFNPAVTMYTTDLALGVTTYPTVTALSTNANIGTITYSPATAPGSITIPVIAEDGTTNNYVISVTATDINEATLSSKVYAAANTIVVEGQVGELVSVMNLAGTVLYKNTITTSPETLNIVLDKGLYLVFINGVSTKVLIK